KHLQDVANLVIDIVLEIAAQSIWIVSLQNAETRTIIIRQGYGYLAISIGDLAEMLAPAGLDQAIGGIIGVVCARLDRTIPEIDGLLGIILNMGNVACWIVGVTQILHPGGWTGGI